MALTLTEQLDNLYTTTWELRKAEVADNIFSATPFWFWLKNNGKLKTESGGRFIMEPLEYAQNETVQWIGKGGTVSLNDYEFLTESRWDWRYLTASMVRFGVDDQQNRGKAAIMKLLNRKIDNTQNSLIDRLEADLFGAQSGDSIDGLQNLVPDNGTDPAGGVDGTTYPWWVNRTSDMTGKSFSVYGRDYMRTMLNDCSNNRTMDKPDIIVSGQTPYEYYDRETEEYRRIVNKTLGDAGFENIQYKGIPMIWSPECANTRMYFLNTKYLYFTYDPMMYFDMTEWKPIPDQVNDRAAQVILACCFSVTRRLCQGVLYNIDTE
jgi:hypothetical protein